MDVNYEHTFVIQINDGETAISPGDFYRMKQSGKFATLKTDETDSIKVIGITPDGTIYVSEKPDDEMSDKECEDYYARKGITNEMIEHMFDPDPNDENDTYIKGMRVY